MDLKDFSYIGVSTYNYNIINMSSISRHLIRKDDMKKLNLYILNKSITLKSYIFKNYNKNNLWRLVKLNKNRGGL